LRGLLERGRRRLAGRLAARGLALSGVLLVPLAAVGVPATLLARPGNLSPIRKVTRRIPLPESGEYSVVSAAGWEGRHAP
jgi:hypothetical protein